MVQRGLAETRERAQRLIMAGSCHRFTFPIVAFAVPIIDSMMFVFDNDRAKRPVTPRRVTVNMSSRPSRRLAAASS